MKIYLLNLNTSWHDINTSSDVNVYSSLERAKEDGMKRLSDVIDYRLLVRKKDVNKEIEMEMERFFLNNWFSYEFRITEIPDLEYAENFNLSLDSDEEYLKLEPTCKEYCFNYKGDLKALHLIYGMYNTLHYGMTQYPSDLETGAGEKFKVGDIVKVARERTYENRKLPERLCVVKSIPKRIDGQKYFKNTYDLLFIDDTGEYSGNIGGLFTKEYHEKDIVKFDEKVDTNSAIGVLQKIVKGELKINDDLWKSLEKGEISFDTRKNFRDINELRNNV